LDELTLHTLNVNYSRLVDLLDVDSDITAELMSANCISWAQKDHIEAGRTKRDRAKLLLDILRRRSRADYSSFIRCLNKSKREHLAALLTNGGGNF
jgi:type II secretory pathway component PulK